MNRSYRSNTQPQTPVQQRQTRQTGASTGYVSSGFSQVGQQQAAAVTPQQPAVQQVRQQPAAPVTPIKPLQQQQPNQQVQAMDIVVKGENGGTDENVKIVKFQARGKVSAKQRRARANRRLRKLLCPKTAVMALHELRNKDVELDFKVSDSPINGQFKAETVFEGKLYTGFGAGKQAARNHVAEKILRDMVIERMKKNPKKEPKEPKKEGEEADKSQDNPDVEMTDANEEEEVPMTHLASYALHKLFAEWAKDGYEVPDFRTPVGEVVGQIKPPNVNSAPKTRAELPPNAAKTHPAMLLQVMRPGTQYQDLGSQGSTPNIVHAIGITVDGQQYIGSGKSKKIARKEAARTACEKLFNVEFLAEALTGPN